MRKLKFKSFGFFILFFGMSLLLLSCQEEDPLTDFNLETDDYSDAPVFQFSDEGTGVEIKAGVNNFYMFTDYDTTSNGQIVFRSAFRKLENCVSDCEESLKFYFNSSNSDYSNGDILNNAAISIGEHIYANGQTIIPGEIIVEYTGRNDVTYRTDQITQPNESYFRINSVIDYLKNENSDPTKQIQIELSCILKSVSGEELIEFTNASATIAVAYPE